MTKEEKYALQEQINNLKAQLREADEAQFVEDIHAAEEKFLGRYFEYKGKLIHPVSVLTPECPYQVWCIVIDAPHGFSCKHNLHKVYMGPADKYTYWLAYQPMYMKRYFHKSFDNDKEMHEITKEEFDVAAEAAFRQMWEQVHETITDANFKEKVKSMYDPILTGL